jgi:CspA family cold shock protein
MENGTVKWFNDQSGYGIIEWKNEKSVIVRSSEIRTPSVEYLCEGDRVRFDLKKGAECSFAVNVSVL